jgi:cell wall-associated NlpC family hydrolase
MHTGDELAALAKGILPKHWGYIWGKAGVKWTAEMQDEMDKTTDKKYDSARKYGRKWVGHTVADCSGLVKYICRQFKVTVPHGSNSQWRDSLFEKGAISGNAVPVCALVFKLLNGDDFYHVGIYVGDGKVVEASSSKGCVVVRDLWQTKNYPIIMFGRPYQ